MKRKSVIRLIAAMLSAVLVIAPLSGCGSFGTSASNAGNTFVEQEDGSASVNVSSLGEGEDFIEYIKGNFASSSLPEDYNQPMLDLPKDYVFEFECSEEAGYNAFMAFEVYDTTDYADARSLSWCDYENGKITVSPNGPILLNANGSGNVHDGTWGSLNQLYLVQKIDLTTGEELERPIVTPFTIKHDLNAPIIHQGVDESNNYTLSWNAVPDAVEYRVYEHSGDEVYDLACVTTDTTVTVSEFARQKEMENYEQLIEQEYIDAGQGEAVDIEGISNMNYGVEYSDDLEDGYFVVVAVGADGRQSGISNMEDVREIANKLPASIVDSVIEVDIASVEDIPTYVDVEMLDGSVQKMVIDYHGAKVYYGYPDNEYKVTIQARVANTLFDKFFITLYGMTYENMKADFSVVTERQDEILSRTSGVEEPEINVSYAPSEEMNTAVEEFREVWNKEEPSEVPSEEPSQIFSEEPSVEPSEESSEIFSEEPSEIFSEEPSVEPNEEPSENLSDVPSVSENEASVPVQLLGATALEVQEVINMLGSDKVNTVLYASNDLEAWIAMCLIAQCEIIPIPVEVFQDAANLDYTISLLVEAYRQNPTSGFICNVGYASEYQSLVVEYLEVSEVRLEKAQDEIDAAYNIASQVVTAGMSDYEKVLAINEYFRNNASYDFDSMATDISDYSTLSEQFIDAHTPYGIICNNYGVCESYSEAFILTARFAGLEAMCEFGTIYGGAHEWNRVKVDDSWCVLDVTNNDIDIFVNGLFNVTDEQIKGILVPDNNAIMNHQNYLATDFTKEYYYMNGCAVTDVSQAADMVAEQLQESGYALVRIPADTTKEELEELFSKLIFEEGVNFSQAGTNLNLLYVSK